jgi:hypothetical protein
MKKIILLFMPIILLSTTLFANEKLYSFIGIQASPSVFNNTFAPSVAIKYGKQSKDIRTSIAYGYGKSSKNIYQTLIMQIDSAILTQTFKDIVLKPYLGVSFGVIQHKNSELIAYNDKGFIYGLNTGLSYVLNNNVDFDLGYRFMKTSKLKEIESINDVSLSMHYFY